MYGPKKTPHFISKNQLLPFPNLAHLLKAQDQGGLCVDSSRLYFAEMQSETDDYLNL